MHSAGQFSISAEREWKVSAYVSKTLEWRAERLTERERLKMNFRDEKSDRLLKRIGARES